MSPTSPATPTDRYLDAVDQVFADYQVSSKPGQTAAGVVWYLPDQQGTPRDLVANVQVGQTTQWMIVTHPLDSAFGAVDNMLRVSGTSVNTTIGYANGITDAVTGLDEFGALVQPAVGPVDQRRSNRLAQQRSQPLPLLPQ